VIWALLLILIILALLPLPVDITIINADKVLLAHVVTLIEKGVHT
jgi:hypothetical protein